MLPTDAERIESALLHPRIVDLWLALQALGSVASFAQSGAHPDDETSALLAALRFRDGLSTAYINATRGEGGQNDLGWEQGADLAVLRTAEMERAAERLDMRLWWLSSGPGDSIADFGFSKSGADTLARWGRAHTLARFVAAVRGERPDCLCPTFLDVPGQHGHHRAMTELAHEVMGAAADPAFPCPLPPWQVKKLYFPAWGGGGTSYDDALPPPAATLTVAGGGADPVTGWSWEQIGQAARLSHRSQGMGRWVPAGTARDWPLHLAETGIGPDRGRIGDNLPDTLADLGLPQAGAALARARAAFPDFAAVAAHAGRALSLLAEARVDANDRHRIARKQRELARVLSLAAGISARGHSASPVLLPGESLELWLELDRGAADAATLAPLLPPGWQARPLPPRASAAGAADPGPGLPRPGFARWEVHASAEAAPSDPFPMSFDPLQPALPALDLRAEVGGAAFACRLPLGCPPQLASAVATDLQPDRAFVNLALPSAPLHIALIGCRPAGALARLDLPAGWTQQPQVGGLRLTPPSDLAAGLIEARLTLDGLPALSERRIARPHVAPRLRSQPARLLLRAAAVALPSVRLGYAGSGHDRVAHWLTAMGLAVEALDDARLAGAAPFAGLDALVVGVLSFARPALAAALPALHDWVAAGGTLVTLYHRPRDGWNPEHTPPMRLQIGLPSLRWRVTDASAPVTLLEPDHPLLTRPNRIGPEDWAGWHKERGLYFASAWDPAYRPLLALSDPGEAPLTGGLLSARIGQGRHSHVALNLHHQLDALVPGAFRLMANLVAPGD